MSVPNQATYICSQCQQPFSSKSNEEHFNATQSYPELICPACQGVRSHKRGTGRDQGQSHIMHGPCAVCGSETEYFPMTKGQHTIYCPDCNKAYSSSSY